MKNKNIAVLGIFFGDEAKGRCAYEFSKNFDYIVRTSGANNCGHTIYHNGVKIVRNFIPSANFAEVRNKAFLGSGMVIEPEALLKEIIITESQFPGAAKRIIVDPDCFVISKEHLEEDKQNVKTIGSTGKGVSPAYRDKIYRKGTRLINLLKDNHEAIVALKNIGVQFKHSLEMYDVFMQSDILFEGAQSILLDINHGTYPFVTSGDCSTSSILNSGFAFAMPQKIYGVAKCYSTRVGDGPFPTEIFGDQAENLRKAGSEYGATTGRPRRVGWLDLAALKYASIKGGVTDLIVTKFDILNGWDTVPVCVGYSKEPVCPDDFKSVNTKIIKVVGWENAKKTEQLETFISVIEDVVKVPVGYISCGTAPEDLINISKR